MRRVARERHQVARHRRSRWTWLRLLATRHFVTRVGIGELRDGVSRYVRRAAKGETIVIVNRDREVAVLQPWRGRARRRGRLLGALKGTARVTGDIVGPTHDEEHWFRT